MIERIEERGKRREERGKRKEERGMRNKELQGWVQLLIFCILAFFYPMVSDEVKKKP